MNVRRTAVLIPGALAAAVATGTIALGAGAALAATPSTAGTAAPSAAAAKCDAGAWAGRIQGAPKAFKAGDASGDYLWHDTHGLHLRVTQHSSSRTVYTGVITTSSTLRIDPVKLEKGDSVKKSADGKSLIFVFSNYGHVDGVNFHTDCASSITVSKLTRGNKALPKSDVYLGTTKSHPGSIPFTVHRKAAA